MNPLLPVLKDTLRCLEAHLEDAAAKEGVSVNVLCPCFDGEVKAAKAAIALEERLGDPDQTIVRLAMPPEAAAKIMELWTTKKLDLGPDFPIEEVKPIENQGD